MNKNIIGKSILYKQRRQQRPLTRDTLGQSGLGRAAQTRFRFSPLECPYHYPQCITDLFQNKSVAYFQPRLILAVVLPFLQIIILPDYESLWCKKWTESGYSQFPVHRKFVGLQEFCCQLNFWPDFSKFSSRV